MAYSPSTAAVWHFTAAAHRAARRIEGGPAAAPSLRPAVAVHQDGIGGRGHPVERCRFLPDQANSTLCRPGRAAGILPSAKVRWRRAARRGAGRPSWLRYCNVTFSPGRISQWAMAALAARIPGGLHGGGAPHFAMGGPHGGGGPHGTPLRLGTRSRLGGGRPAERRFTVGGSGKSVARCHRTVLAYWKFEIHLPPAESRVRT